MTTEQLVEVFEKYGEDEFLKGDSVERKTAREDLAAFTILDRLVQGGGDIVAAAEHDQIWLGIDLDALAAAATELDIVTLIRLGVLLDSDTESLFMFV